MTSSPTARDAKDLEGFPFERPVDLPDAGDAGCQGRLAIRRLQVGHEVDNLLRLQGIEEAFRHQGHGEHFARGDLGLRHGQLHATRHHGIKHIGRFGLNDAANSVAGLKFKDVELIVFPDEGVRIEDVLEEVIEVGTIRTRQARSD